MNAVGRNDSIGVVSFSGNGTDCDDDSVQVAPLEIATLSVREDTADAIERIIATGRTNLGSGVERASLMFEAVPATEPRRLLLLSDGMATEAPYLTEAAPGCIPSIARAQAELVQINTIALGRDANEAVLMEAANETGGLHRMIDVELEAVGGGGGLRIGGGGGGESATETLSTANKLSDAFLVALAHARQLERLRHNCGTLQTRGPTTLNVSVSEADRDAPVLVYAHWDDPRAVSQVRIVDLRGREFTNFVMYAGPGHAVFHLRGGLPAGALVEFDVSRSVQAAAGVLGRVGNGVTAYTTVAHLPEAVPGGNSRDVPFIQGLPVTLLAQVRDRSGPLTGAQVTARVELPDGTILGDDCSLVLRDDGSQNDGIAADGIYGLVFRQTQQAGGGAAINDPEPTRLAEAAAPRISSTCKSVATTTPALPFERQVSTTFIVVPDGKDSDNDGLPNTYESSSSNSGRHDAD